MTHFLRGLIVVTKHNKTNDDEVTDAIYESCVPFAAGAFRALVMVALPGEIYKNEIDKCDHIEPMKPPPADTPAVVERLSSPLIYS